MGIRLRCYKRI